MKTNLFLLSVVIFCTSFSCKENLKNLEVEIIPNSFTQNEFAKCNNGIVEINDSLFNHFDSLSIVPFEYRTYDYLEYDQQLFSRYNLGDMERNPDIINNKLVLAIGIGSGCPKREAKLYLKKAHNENLGSKTFIFAFDSGKKQHVPYEEAYGRIKICFDLSNYISITDTLINLKIIDRSISQISIPLNH